VRSKTPQKCVYKKSMSKPFSKQKPTKIPMSVVPRLLLVSSRFRVFISDGRWDFKNTTKNILQGSHKTVVSKGFYNKNRQKPKTDCLSALLSRFWAFLGEGSSKTPQKNVKKRYLTLVIFLPLTHPLTTGVTDFCLVAPCSAFCLLAPAPGPRGHTPHQQVLGAAFEV
jgi:hypothetical protein